MKWFIYLTVDSVVDIKNIIPGSNNIILRTLKLNQFDILKYIWIKI